MSGARELERLLAAERAERRPAAAAEQGFSDLSGALSAGSPALGVAHGPLKLGTALTAKWLAGVGMIAVAVAGSSLALFPTPPPRPPTVVSAPSAQQLSAPPAQHRAPHAPFAGPLESATPHAKLAELPRKAPSEVAATAEAPAPPPSASTAASTFAEEFRLMKAAKEALDAGKLHLVQVWLDEHARLYPLGVFQGERRALQVLLACRRAPQAGASEARRYIEQNPSSPFIDRIARACQLDGAAAPLPANFPDGGK
jgi:hypothetical protein